jgi:magnesium transporter
MGGIISFISLRNYGTLMYTDSMVNRAIKRSRLFPQAVEPASPGTVRYIGKDRDHRVKIDLIQYSSEFVREVAVESVDSLAHHLGDFGSGSDYFWVNVSGVHETEVLEQLGELLSLHPLVLEDIANTSHRAKIEEYEDSLFIIMKMVSYQTHSSQIVLEQMSIILMPQLVVTFQEVDGDPLNPVRARLRSGKGRLRKSGSDYLTYAIMDAVIDYYYTALEQLGEQIEEVETRLVSHPTHHTLTSIYKLKHELMYMRKSIWPARDMIGQLMRLEHPIIGETLHVYLRDIYDHTVQIVETTETLRDMASSMLDLYLSTVSQRLNEVMKILTIFSAIFIPLTFITSLYGMNFKYMPELDFRYGYFVLIGVLVMITIGLFIFFRKKKWL